MPARLSAVITDRSGRPKVKLTTGTGSLTSRSTLADQASSSSTGVIPSSRRPYGSASAWTAAA